MGSNASWRMKASIFFTADSPGDGKALSIRTVGVAGHGVFGPLSKIARGGCSKRSRVQICTRAGALDPILAT
jgi:hypothetical protein